MNEKPYLIRKSTIGRRQWWWQHTGCVTKRGYLTREDAQHGADIHAQAHEWLEAR
jgi:predicted aminopeptidase